MSSNGSGLQAEVLALAAAIPQLVWSARANGSTDFLNDRWYAFTGQASDEPFEWAHSAIHPEDLDRAQAAWQTAVRTGQLYEVEYRLRRRDGAYRWHLARGVPFCDELGRVKRWFGTCTDIHEQRRAVERAAQLQAVAADFAGAITRREVADIVARQGLTALEADAGNVYLTVPGTDTIERVAGAAYPPEVSAQYAALHLDQRTPNTDAVRSGHPVWLETQADWERQYPDLAVVHANAGFEAAASVPLLVNHGAVGVLGLSFRGARQFAEADRELILALGRQAAQSLERARLYEAERQARALAEAAERRQALLARVGASMAAPLNYAERLRALTDALVPELADWCVVNELDDTGTPRRAAVTCARSDQADLAHALEACGPIEALDSESPTARALRTGETQLIQVVDPASLSRLVGDPHDARLILAAAPRSVVVTPLRARGHIVATLALAYAGSDRHYQPEDAAIIEQIGHHAGVLLDNARLNAADRLARAEAEAAVRARNEFLSIASHELKTPTAGLRATAQMLRRAFERGQLDDERLRTNLDRINVAASRLGVLIESLLDVSRLQAGQLRLEPKQVDLEKLVDDVAAGCADWAGERGQKITVGGTGATSMVEADPVRVAQVLGNLLDNALKYSSDDDEIHVSVEDDQGGVRIDVQDHGIGLPPGSEELIFDPFRRAANASLRQIQGLGLGLSICRQIVERHAGRIWATSPGEGLGTTLHVWLPARTATGAGGHAQDG